MKNSRFKILVTLLAWMMIMWGGCYYDSVIFPGGGEVEGEVYFSEHVIPILEKDCSISGCHNTGGQKPDLSNANAYSSLTTGNYIDVASPEDSELYLWMKGLKALAMPPSGTNATNTAIVLAWIQQGALNN